MVTLKNSLSVRTFCDDGPYYMGGEAIEWRATLDGANYGMVSYAGIAKGFTAQQVAEVVKRMAEDIGQLVSGAPDEEA